MPALRRAQSSRNRPRQRNGSLCRSSRSTGPSSTNPKMGGANSGRRSGEQCGAVGGRLAARSGAQECRRRTNRLRAPNGCGMQIATLTGPCSPPRQRIGDGPCPEPRSTLLTLGGGGRSSKKSGNTSQSWSKVQHISLGRPYARLQGFPSPPSRRKMATCGAGPRLDCGRGRPSCRTDLTRRLITSWL